MRRRARDAAAVMVVLAAVLSAEPAPTGAGQNTPPAPDAAETARLAAEVRTEFLFAWNSYKQFAWGHDELNPVSRTPHDWYPPAVLYMTPVDALDTMLIMGLDTEAADTSRYLLDHLSFDQDVQVQLFEVNIRLLGGLLSAYGLTGTPKFLTLAEDLGTRLLPAFDSPTGMPYRFVNLRTGRTSGRESNPAEIGTLIVEFGTLSRLTGKPVYYDRAKHALVALFNRRDATTGLVGSSIDVDTGAWTGTHSHIGGGIDSYYEYLLKCNRLFGDADCGFMWKQSLAAVNRYLADDGPGGLWYGVADMHTGARTATTYGSLQAFFPAVLAMGGDLDRARRLQASGFRMWQLHGIEPETLDYRTMQVGEPGYRLRPEIVESAYYLYHYTHDPRYLAMGRTFFDAIRKYCRTDSGYTALRSVVSKQQGDRQYSFFLAETLKYLYLLFDPNALDFDSVVFNTEAHVMKRALVK